MFVYFWLETGLAKLHNLEFFSGRFVEWGIPFPTFSATLSGATVSFFFVDKDGQSRSVRGTVAGDKFDGWLRFPTHETRVTGQRAPAPARS